MSNREPRAIVVQGISRIGGLYKFQFDWKKRLGKSGDGLAHPPIAVLTCGSRRGRNRHPALGYRPLPQA